MSRERWLEWIKKGRMKELTRRCSMGQEREIESIERENRNQQMTDWTNERGDVQLNKKERSNKLMKREIEWVKNERRNGSTEIDWMNPEREIEHRDNEGINEDGTKRQSSAEWKKKERLNGSARIEQMNRDGLNESLKTAWMNEQREIGWIIKDSLNEWMMKDGLNE